MKLVEVGFTHYAPKDSSSGIKEYLVVDDLEDALIYIDKEYLHNDLFDNQQEEETFSIPDEWLADKEKLDAAEQLGLKLDISEYGYGHVEGPKNSITRWYQGTDWQEAEDAYYGVTHYFWNKVRAIDESEAAVLVRLGIAKDLRHLNSPS